MRSILTLAALALSTPALAGTLVFDGFADTSLLTLNGGASVKVTADGTVLRVTRAAGGQAGSFFSSATSTATT